MTDARKSGGDSTELKFAHWQEVRGGSRFEFGRNWSRFLANLTDRRVDLAEQSLRAMLEVERLDGKSFLDIGSGSGLFSLAARRLGARVHSFDYDPQSVTCTRELRRRYFADDQDWVVEHGSALDKDYLSSFGTFDIVYSWGVLHHTGKMWTALDNIKPLVPRGGRLFIAIYNDLGLTTDNWARVKKTYCALPKPVAALYALGIIFRDEWRALLGCLRNRSIGQWVRNWTHYDRMSTRGMSRWHDWIDWIGGYPYERAKLEEVVDFCGKDGFRLTKLVDRSTGTGCNEFVFTREEAEGTFVDNPVPGGTSLGHRYGRRVIGPFRREETAPAIFVCGQWRLDEEGRVRFRYEAPGVSGFMPHPPPQPFGADLYVFCNGELLGKAELLLNSRVLIPGITDLEQIEHSVVHVIALKEKELSQSFTRIRGRMWAVPLPDLAADADSVDNSSRSALLLFEGEKCLPNAHAPHDAIARLGGGRYSHWGENLYFSSTDGTDPNVNGRRYRVLTPVTTVSG